MLVVVTIRSFITQLVILCQIPSNLAIIVLWCCFCVSISIGRPHPFNQPRRALGGAASEQARVREEFLMRKREAAMNKARGRADYGNYGGVSLPGTAVFTSQIVGIIIVMKYHPTCSLLASTSFQNHWPPAAQPGEDINLNHDWEGCFAWLPFFLCQIRAKDGKKCRQSKG